MVVISSRFSTIPMLTCAFISHLRRAEARSSLLKNSFSFRLLSSSSSLVEGQMADCDGVYNFFSMKLDSLCSLCFSVGRGYLIKLDSLKKKRKKGLTLITSCWVILSARPHFKGNTCFKPCGFFFSFLFSFFFLTNQNMVFWGFFFFSSFSLVHGCWSFETAFEGKFAGCFKSPCRSP